MYVTRRKKIFSNLKSQQEQSDTDIPFFYHLPFVSSLSQFSSNFTRLGLYKDLKLAGNMSYGGGGYGGSRGGGYGGGNSGYSNGYDDNQSRYSGKHSGVQNYSTFYSNGYDYPRFKIKV